MAQSRQGLEEQIAAVREERLRIQQRISLTREKIAQLDLQLQKQPAARQKSQKSRAERIQELIWELRRLLPRGQSLVILDGPERGARRPQIDVSKAQSSQGGVCEIQGGNRPFSQEDEDGRAAEPPACGSDPREWPHTAADNLLIFSFEDTRSFHYDPTGPFSFEIVDTIQYIPNGLPDIPRPRYLEPFDRSFNEAENCCPHVESAADDYDQDREILTLCK